MNEDYTHITVVIDRSGSMGGVWSDVQGWYTDLVAQHRKADGKCTLTTVVFDNNIDTIEKGTNIDKAKPNLTCYPRSLTKLLDAIGESIITTDRYIKKMPKSRRPAKVLFMIQTDGLENNSCEFSRDQIRELIDKHTTELDWNFLFLGANMAAVRESRNLGIRNSVNYSEKKTKEALELVTTKTINTRSASMVGYKASYVVTPNEASSIQ